MYKIKFTIVVFTVSVCISFSGCNNIHAAKENKSTTAGKEVINATPVNEIIPTNPVVNIIKSDTAQVLSNITAFLRWYKDNYKKANAFPILIKDSAENYMVNHAAYTDYLKFIAGNHLISQEYIAYWKTYFDDKETELRNYPIKTVAPEGFDFDIVLITQKPEVILNKIDQLRYNVISMSDSAAMVGLKLPRNKSSEYEVAMIKEKGDWKIEFISTPNFD